MIQKNSKYDEIAIKIQQICQQTLGFFVQKVPLQKSNFPILEVTYTLWRKHSYRRVKKIINQSQQGEANCINKLFHSISQKKYLPKFIQRVEAQMNRYSRGLHTVQQQFRQMQKLPKEQEQVYGLIVDLGQNVWQQQLYVQLIQDLIRLPYIQIINQNSTIIVKQEFATNLNYQQKQSKIKSIANNTGKNIFNKALTAITGSVVSKAFLIKINTLFGVFNPIAIGATLGMTSYLNHLDKKKKDEALQLQLRLAKQYTVIKVERLKKIYQDCLEQIELLLNYAPREIQEIERHKKMLKQLFMRVFQQQWLQIQVINDNDGWQTVLLEQKESFQQL